MRGPEFPRPDVLEYFGVWRRRRQPRPNEPEEQGGLARPVPGNGNPATIFTVQGPIRDVEPTAYEPTVVSIGPLHRNISPEAMEGTKKECVDEILLRWRRDTGRDINDGRNEYMEKIRDLQGGARRCYPEHSLNDLSDEEFAEILLRDGCFILHHLLTEFENNERSSSRCCWEWMVKKRKPRNNRAEVELQSPGDDGGNSEVTFLLPTYNRQERHSRMKYDLLKIGNQIPFYVIETLFDPLRTPGEGEDLVDIALSFFENLHPKRAKPHFKIKGNQVDHLLQLFHMSIIPESLPCIRPPGDTYSTEELRDAIHSATNLQELGVKFRKGEGKAGNFLNISFRRRGVMEMGPIHVFSYSSSVFRNLIAYEQRIAVAPYVTIYAFFMRTIMRTEEDLRLLRSKGIVLMNRRGSDEEAASFFGRLCENVGYPDRSDYLRDVYIEARKFHDSKSHDRRDWKAILGRACAVLGMIGGGITFLLSNEQAYFAACPYLRHLMKCPSPPPSN